MSKKSCNFAIKFSNDNKTMGLVKKMKMEREEAPFPNIPSRYASKICLRMLICMHN